MLLGAVLLWALNITVSKYMLEHGWRPLAYGTIRYFAAISLFWVYTYWRERSFRIARSDFRLVGVAALAIFVNQVCFVYSLKLAQAVDACRSLFGTTPVFVGAARARACGSSGSSASFWIGAGLTFAGVALDRGRRRRRARRRLAGRSSSAIAPPSPGRATRSRSRR